MTNLKNRVTARAAHIMGPEGRVLTGRDFLIGGGVTANFFCGRFDPWTANVDRVR